MKNGWTKSVVTKFMVGFAIVIMTTMAAFVFVYDQAHQLARKITYEKLYSQATYYLQSFDTELKHIRQLQNDFFNDRKLIFVIDPNMNISDYEKRDCLLSVQDRISSVTGVSNLIEDAALYLPRTDYLIKPSAVSSMYPHDVDKMNWYLEYLDDQIHFDGNSFFIVKTGVPRIRSTSIPYHVFVLTLSKNAIINSLTVINAGDNEGAFWYNQREDVLLEHSTGEYVGSRLLPLLQKNTDGAYESIQRLQVDGKSYLIFVGGYGELGLFVRYELESTVMEPIFRFRTLSFVVLGVLTVLALIISGYMIGSIRKPINTLLHGFHRVQSGNWKEHITDHRRDEFSYLYRGFNAMEDRIARLIDEVYVQTNLTQRAQMKQLQTQIAPHFLYNSFFVLSRRIKREDYENAELLAKHLGTYFQYITRNEADYVPLQRETDHARSYAAIQGARFVNRIRIEFADTPEHFAHLIVPRLILQPLLENAFEYGLENRVKDGLLSVHFEETDSEWQIWVEDNGEQISDEELENIASTLVHGKQGEITGLFNIHKRLQIYFREQGGIRIQRSLLGGTAVIIFIGKGAETYEHESADRG